MAFTYTNKNKRRHSYKRYALYLFQMFLISTLYSQTTFSYYFSSPQDDIVNSIIEDESNNLLFTVENSEFGLIMKLSPLGVLIDSVHLMNPNGSCNLCELIKLDTTRFVALGNWNSDSTSELWYVRLDYGLQVIEQKKINTDGNMIFGFRHIIKNNGNIVFIALYMKPQTTYNACIYELTPDGLIIRNRYFASYSFNESYTLLDYPSKDAYKVFSFYPLGTRGLCFLNTIDTNFNVLDTVYFSDYIEDLNTAKWTEDSNYIITGEMFPSENGEREMGILKVNQSDSVLMCHYYGKPDTNDLPGLTKNLDFIEPDHIFYAGTSNNNNYPFQQEPSWIMLNILDSNLNLKEQQLYGGDAFYIVNTVLATNDSGFVMVCSRYDYLVQDHEYDIYILKVNKDGLLVSTPETPELNRHLCTVYPNPGSEMVNVNSIKDGLQFQLIDLTGKLQLATALGKGNNLLDASGLAAGIYLYRIMDNENQTVQTGKWLRAY